MANLKKQKRLEEFRKIFKGCGILEEDYNFWEDKYKKRQKAMEKFGYIETDYEGIKIRGFEEDCNETYIFGYWCRSIIASQYNLQHPPYMEYKAHYQVGDVDWLKKGYSFVDVDKYIKWKNQQNKTEE